MSTRSLELESTIGDVFIGAVLSAALYGTTLAQFAHYCEDYFRHDSLHVKALVCLMMMLDTLMAVSDAGTCWYYTVRHHGNASALQDSPRFFALAYAALRATIFIVQLFYVRGIWILLKRYELGRKARVALTLPPVVFSTLALVGVYANVSSGWDIDKVYSASEAPTTINSTTAAAADIYICVLLWWALRSRITGFRNTDSLIRKLAGYIVTRGILTTIVQIALVITFYLDDLDKLEELNITALRMLVKDLLILFQACNEGIINVLEHYFEMFRTDVEEALNTYWQFCKETERVVENLGVAKKLQNILNVPIPNLR
ncbi:hypothetical protein FOMPIDRAFT_89611 [Fomitopsis schrenkii]|uniref:AP180 N-terminal homology (ANTH) domain-containing protein n=1 Tax=Fomitopsis schrenkii TaxID=2126942 RepID=S8F899_FOMSC|nr:hypothetical protein FOMPIDRAFT_89611 [Fomitopsis schrenkii]